MKSIKEYCILTFGTLLIGLGIYFFKFPNHFSTGGVSGLAVILNYLMPQVNASNFTVILNILALLLGFIFIGKSFSIKTIYCSLLLSAILYVFENMYPLDVPLTNQPALEICFAVLLTTIGEAFLLNYKGSSGGTDILAMILKKYTSIRIGKALFIIDVLITVASGMCYGIQIGLFSFFGLIAKSILVDRSIEYLNLSINCFLVTNHSDEVCDFIVNKLHRGATVMDCNGGYTGNKKKAIVTVMKRQEVNELKKYVSLLDKESFLITNETSDICGKGFPTLI